MTTNRAGGLRYPLGISHAKTIGSSNDPPLAVIAPEPQMRQSLKNCLPLGEGGSHRLTDEVSLTQDNYSSTTTMFPLLPQENATWLLASFG